MSATNRPSAIPSACSENIVSINELARAATILRLADWFTPWRLTCSGNEAALSEFRAQINYFTSRVELAPPPVKGHNLPDKKMCILRTRDWNMMSLN